MTTTAGGGLRRPRSLAALLTTLSLPRRLALGGILLLLACAAPAAAAGPGGGVAGVAAAIGTGAAGTAQGAIDTAGGDTAGTAAGGSGTAASTGDMGTGDAAAAEAAPQPRKFRIGVELTTNFRHSDDYRFPLNDPYLPGPAAGHAQETVDPGSHFEVSNVALLMDYRPSDLIAAHLRFNGVNLYYRNPTSTDRQYDLAEVWLRAGRETPRATLPVRPGVYLKVGKFSRPERQEDRHLQSYGLAGTAFNLFEDAGLEAGADLGRHLYVKAAFTQGNPLFVRDPDALAGDTPNLLLDPAAARLNSGLTILYDTHVEHIDFDHPETAGYLGWRIGDSAGGNDLELMLWGRRRTLASTVGLPGSPLGGDLASLVGPGGEPLLPYRGNGKQEVGANLWAYLLHGLSLYGQLVKQEVAGLGRTGVEAEAAWKIELPLLLAAGGHQLFSFIAPAVRYSKLHNEFQNLRPTPEPTLAWDWEKLDGGIRCGLWTDIDLTVEYSYNRIYLTPQIVANANETLATLRIRVW